MEMGLVVMLSAVPRYSPTIRGCGDEEREKAQKLRPSGQSKAYLLRRLADCLVTGKEGGGCDHMRTVDRPVVCLISIRSPSSSDLCFVQLTCRLVWIKKGTDGFSVVPEKSLCRHE